MELYAPRTKDLTIAAYSTDDSQKPVVERSQIQKNIDSSIPFVEVQNQTILLFWLICKVTQQREAKKSSPSKRTVQIEASDTLNVMQYVQNPKEVGVPGS